MTAENDLCPLHSATLSRSLSLSAFLSASRAYRKKSNPPHNNCYISQTTQSLRRAVTARLQSDYLEVPRIRTEKMGPVRIVKIVILRVARALHVGNAGKSQASQLGSTSVQRRPRTHEYPQQQAKPTPHQLINDPPQRRNEKNGQRS